MPRSVLLGRPWPAPGEPLFTEEDTGYALALAEEERDTCPMCGYPKAWCRDPEFQFPAFEPHEEMCGASHRLAMHKESDVWTSKLESTKDATMLSVGFRAGHEPPMDAGLDLAPDGGSADEHSEDR